MKQFNLVGALWGPLCLLSICVSPAHATAVSGQGTWESKLEGRDLDGNTETFEAYYDTVLNITWLADADLARTSGFDDNGEMSWENANAWAAGLDVNGVTGWRLPTLGPIDGNSFNRTIANNGTTDMGWTWTTTDGSDGGWRDINGNPVSELGHMFYVHLGNRGICTPEGSGSSTNCDTQAGYGLINTGPFSNVSDALYWTDLEWGQDAGWNFYTGHGRQKHSQKWRQSHAWAVHDGDVGIPTGPVDLSGSVKTAGEQDICAMVLASGKFMFSCNPAGVFAFTNLPRENDGTVKRQIYADGFFPKIDIMTGSSNDAVVMTRSGTCPGYNTPYAPAFVPDSAGKRINISGNVLTQNTQTPICAMVLANGQHMFSCDSSGSYALSIPLDTNGQFKLQVYADGFAPTIQTFDESRTTGNVRMARAAECQ